MAKNNVLVQKIHGRDERGAFTKHIYSDGNEYIVREFVRDCSIPENKDAKTYAERIAPQAIPFEKYLAENGLTAGEWWRIHEEAALSELYGCEIRTTILSRDAPIAV